MKKFKKIRITFCILILIFGIVSCHDLEEEKVGGTKGLLVIWFETILGSSGPYDSACQNPSESSILPLNAPVSITGNSKRYRMTTGPNGLKYSFTLSADYPACGVNLIIKNCLRPNIRATDSLVACNQGSYSNYVSAGTQTCTIPSFANQLVLILIEPNSDQYPNTSCATITFEALP